MSLPKVSVIIPVYNVQPYIDRCIKSLRSQLLDGLEFIFVDDCSTDGSMAEVEAWAAEDERVRILRNGQNLGAGPSRNRGIEVARGDYLSFVDPDDYISPDFYKRLYAAAIRGGGHDIAKGRCCLVDGETGFVGQADDRQNRNILKHLRKKKPLYLWFLNEHWTAIWRKSLFDNPKVRYGTSITAQDTTFQLAACYQTNDIVFEDDALYYYVQRSDSATHRDLRVRTFGEVDSLDEKLSFLLSEGIDPSGAEYFHKRVNILIRRLQAVLGKGLIDRSDVALVSLKLLEMLSRVFGSAPQAHKWQPIRQVAQRMLRIAPGERAAREGKVRVSVILPVYNPGPSIRTCIESLRSQLLNGLEFIFVDDCSTDGSMEKVEAWAAEDGRVRILRNEQNLGAGPSRNRGIEEARGDYLSFVDPDDYVSLEFYERLYAAAVADGGHDIAKGIREKMSVDGTRNCTLTKQVNHRIRDARRNRTPLFTAFSSEHQAAIYKHSLFDRGARNGTSRKDEDTTFLLSACLLSEDITLEEAAVYHYVMRPESSVNSYRLESLMGELDSIAEKAALLEAKGVDKHTKRYLSARVAIRLTNYYAGIHYNPPLADAFDEYTQKLTGIVDHLPALAFLKNESPSYRALIEHHALLPFVGSLPEELKAEGAHDWMKFVRQTPNAGLTYCSACAQAQESTLRSIHRSQGLHECWLAYQQILKEINELPPKPRAAILFSLHRYLARKLNVPTLYRVLRKHMQLF